ncbi:MAG: bifunctional diguanylate cyclase/phosphodiesterase [Rhodospirillaceae bacterium]
MQEATTRMPPRQELDRLRAALAAAGDVAYEWDLLSDRMIWLDGADAALGMNAGREAATGEAFRAFVAPEYVAARNRALSLVEAGSALFECEYRLDLPRHGERLVHDRGRAETDVAGRPVRITGILRFLDHGPKHDSHRDHLANYDALTGHFNRARLREALDHALNFATRYDIEGAYLVIGIDKLTMVNQALGHRAADSVLLAVGDRLDRCLRASDVIGRVGGDKFGVVLSNVPESELESATEKLLNAIRHTPAETPEGPVYVTVSIGAVTFPSAVTTSQDVMMRAEVALQKAKQSGRDCAVTYRFSEQQIAHHRSCIVIAEQVQRALRERRLQFAYQPIVDARTREVRLHECLLRMIQPDGEVVPAARFMPIVEDLGMIRSVDRMVLEQGVDVLALHTDARIAINVSGITTTDRSWMRSAVAMLRGRPDIAERMIVEITETAGLEDIDACGRFVSTLRDLGCEVALDDFGAGYTSFRHLKQLAVTKVKIDGSFVRRIGENPDNLMFIRTLIGLARTFNLETIAECVEDMDEADLLLNEGVDYMQGYAFGRPDLRVPWSQHDLAGGNDADTQADGHVGSRGLLIPLPVAG